MAAVRSFVITRLKRANRVVFLAQEVHDFGRRCAAAGIRQGQPCRHFSREYLHRKPG